MQLPVAIIPRSQSSFKIVKSIGLFSKNEENLQLEDSVSDNPALVLAFTVLNQSVKR